jgi:hypothetical protein
MAFLQCARIAMDATNPGALFRAVAATNGMIRADEKPLRRSLARPLERGGDEGRPRDLERIPGTSPFLVLDEPSGFDLPRPPAGPSRLGEVLRADDGGPREGAPRW